MLDKYIALIQKQIENLEAKDFDLKSWKTASVIIVGRIFGENSKIAEEIDNINYDLSSWSLRDTLAKTSNLEACKNKGRSILNVALNELELLGLPNQNNSSEKKIPVQIIVSALKNELKGIQYQELNDIIKSRKKEADKKTLIAEKFKNYGSDVAEQILSSILATTEFKNEID